MTAEAVVIPFPVGGRAGKPPVARTCEQCEHVYFGQSGGLWCGMYEERTESGAAEECEEYERA